MTTPLTNIPNLSFTTVSKIVCQWQTHISFSPVFGMLSIFPAVDLLWGHCRPKHSVI